MITIDSDKCDPKRLTPRQQLAYIAKKTLGSSQLLSDFRSDMRSLHSEHPIEERLFTEGADELPMTFTQELINRDLREIAADEGSLNSCIDNPSELVDLDGAAQGDEAVEELLPYLPSDIAEFMRSTADLQRIRSDILTKDQHLRSQHK